MKKKKTVKLNNKMKKMKKCCCVVVFAVTFVLGVVLAVVLVFGCCCCCGCFVVVLCPLTHQKETLLSRVCLPFFLSRSFSDFLSVCLSFISCPSSLPFSSFFPFFLSFFPFLLFCWCCVVLLVVWSTSVLFIVLVALAIISSLFLLMSWLLLFCSFCFFGGGGGLLFVVVVFLCCYVVKLAKAKDTNPRMKNNPPKKWKDFRAFWTWPVMLACAKVIIFLGGESSFFSPCLVPNHDKNRFFEDFEDWIFSFFWLRNVGLIFAQ